MSIFFASPCYGNSAHSAYVKSMVLTAGVLGKTNLDWGIEIPSHNDSLIQRARNVIARKFLDTDYEYLAFIDADIEFDPEDVAKIYNLDADIGCGIYPMKNPKKQCFAAWHKGKLVRNLKKFTGPIEVDYAGTGFMFIRRRVLEAFREKWPERIHAENVYDDCFAWFHPRVIDTGNGSWYASEDYAFCFDCRELGFKIIADPTVRLRHHGSYAYGASG